MNGTTHLVSGAASGAWLAVAVSPTPAVALLGVAVGAVSAMTPDLDHGSSRAVRSLWVAGWVLCRLIRVLSHATTGRKHRGLSHSLAFAVLVGGLTGAVSAVWSVPSHAVYLGVSACLGVVVALLGDLVTRAGLDHLLWPSHHRVSIPTRLRIRTGGRCETWLVLPAVSLAVVVGLGLVIGVDAGSA